MLETEMVIEMDNLKLRLHKQVPLGYLNGWIGFELEHYATHPSVLNGNAEFAFVRTFLYESQQAGHYPPKNKMFDYNINWHMRVNKYDRIVEPPVLIWTHSDRGVDVPATSLGNNYGKLAEILITTALEGRSKTRSFLQSEIEKFVSRANLRSISNVYCQN